MTVLIELNDFNAFMKKKHYGDDLFYSHYVVKDNSNSVFRAWVVKLGVVYYIFLAGNQITKIFLGDEKQHTEDVLNNVLMSIRSWAVTHNAVYGWVRNLSDEDG
jgi:hypothetical protein